MCTHSRISHDQRNAFDNVVQNVDAIIHAAAPFNTSANDPSEIIDPAVEGTLAVLTSALEHGSHVKRFIMISSVCAIQNRVSDKPAVFTEADWNETAVKNCEVKGCDASGLDKYEASKMLSERAAWGFMAEHKEELKFDLVSLNPGF